MRSRSLRHCREKEGQSVTTVVPPAHEAPTPQDSRPEFYSCVSRAVSIPTGRCQLSLQLLSTDFQKLLNCDKGNLQAIGDPTRTPALE